MKRQFAAFALGLCIAFTACPAAADTPNLFDLSLEELANVTVTSVSRKPEDISQAASAIFVLTAEDIRRSGAASLPELLRLVPGMNVARVESMRYAVSTRGFNNALAMKLLVLIDGRTVYDPLFSGTIWDEHQLLLEDIERIEVIRGPGASMWGANAMNRVINVITKSSKDTRGGYAAIHGGNEEQAGASFRYGGMLTDNAAYRIYTRYFDRDELERADGGGGAYDQWWASQSGFRIDADPSAKDLLTLQGDVVHVNEQQAYDFIPAVALFDDIKPVHGIINGGNILSRWTRELGERSDWQLQTYYSHMNRDDKPQTININTVDLDFQHRFPLLSWNDVLWGFGYRKDETSTTGTYLIRFHPQDRSADLFTAFVQDEVALIPERLRLIAGIKVEENEYTGIESQPTGRLAWTPNEAQTIWGAVSRAVRTASRMEQDVDVFYSGSLDGGMGMPVVIRGVGNPGGDPNAENVLAYELGYRNQLTPALSIDAATFYNEYSDHLSMEMGPAAQQTDPVPHLLIEIPSGNLLDFRSHGVELAANWQAADSWRLIGSYTYLNIDFDQSSTSTLQMLRVIARESPQHQVSLRSMWSVTEDIDFDAVLRYVDRIALGRYNDVTNNEPIIIPGYSEADLRLAWRPEENLEFALLGQNLLHADHGEWFQGTFGWPYALNERSIWAKISYKF